MNLSDVTGTAAPAPVTDLAWDANHARAFGDQMVELWGELLERLPSMPVGGRATSTEVRAAVTRDVPGEPLAMQELIASLRTLAFEHATYTGHPGFMAYISGAGTVPGAAADLLAAALNQNVGGWRLSPGATEIERHLGRWFASRLGLPETGGVYVTSGGAGTKQSCHRDLARHAANQFIPEFAMPVAWANVLAFSCERT